MKTGIALRSALLLLAVAGLFMLPAAWHRLPGQAWAVAATSNPSASSDAPAGPNAHASGIERVTAETGRPVSEGDRPAPDREIEALRSALRGILVSSGGTRGRWSVLAVSLDHGDTLLALDSSQPLTPASNMKLFTTAAALWSLGPGFRYQTFLLADGPWRDGTLEGDLILYGTGDPTLSERFFPSETAPLDSLARKVRDRGITVIRGDLVVDGTFFHGEELHPEWDARDLNDTYAAPVSSVSFNENLLTVRVTPAQWVGAPPVISTLPEGSGVPVDNLAKTFPAGTRSRVWLLREKPSDPIGIEGEIPLGGAEVWRQLPVPDPLQFTGSELKRALENAGVRVLGTVVVVRDPLASRLSSPDRTAGRTFSNTPRILVQHVSPPLLNILTVTNKESNNFFAETLAKTLGRTVLGDGSFSGGRAVVSDFLVRTVGVPSDQVTVRDGSGLSTSNRASAGVFVQLLQFMAGTPLWEDFWSTLPEAGVRRELERMGGTAAARNLRAKTGTLNHVSALSGMVRTRSGERVLFSVLSNDVVSEFRAKRAEDQIGIRLASLDRPQAN